MSKGIVLKNNLTKETLLKIALLGLIVVAASTSPYFLHIVAKQYFKDKVRQVVRKRARKLRELQKRKLIDFKELPDGSIRIELAHLGKKVLRQYKLEDMQIKKPKAWNRIWRLIIYDIPQKQKKASDAFREKLKGLGLYQLQKSIWISPYDCLAEIEFLCSVFEIDMNKYVYYFEASKIPNEEEAKKFFKL